MAKRKLRDHLLIFVLLFFLALLDGVLSLNLSGFLYQLNSTMIIRTSFVAMVILAILVPKEHFLILDAIVIGFICDLYFNGILGIYTFLFPVIIWLIRLVQPFIPKSPLYIGLLLVISFTLLESGVYSMNLFIGLTDVPIDTFIVNVLGPTILLNVVLYLLMYFPISRFARSIVYYYD